MAEITLGDARDKLAGALATIQEVEKDLYGKPGLDQVAQELVEASEGIDRAVEGLDELALGVNDE
jgi:hypothetical protein